MEEEGAGLCTSPACCWGRAAGEGEEEASKCTSGSLGSGASTSFAGRVAAARPLPLAGNARLEEGRLMGSGADNTCTCIERETKHNQSVVLFLTKIRMPDNDFSVQKLSLHIANFTRIN